ncbi:MAG: alpha/beta hydrolase, partial [Chloroflexota bacterium]|nr:alpha/beta hydrolase [Chloroflexota bacterium]
MEEHVFFSNARGLRLAGLLCCPDAAAKWPLVVSCHGFGSSKDGTLSTAIVEHLERLGVASFRLSFTGHDDSEGDIAQVTVSSGVEDLRAAVGFLGQYD